MIIKLLWKKASLAGLASGADHSFIFEEPFTINDIIDDIRHLKNKMKGDLKSGILIRNEMANKNYTSEFIQNLMTEEGAGVFSARLNVLGHLQQVNFLKQKKIIFLNLNHFVLFFYL